MTAHTLRSYEVWDVATRVFHWVNFVCFIALAGLGTAILFSKSLGVSVDGKILLKTVHVLVGYVFVANLGFRFLWAFVGNRFARWRAFLPFGCGFVGEAKSYIGGFGTAHGPAYVGHNPIAKVMVLVLFLALSSQAVTGLVLAGTDIYYPPFGSYFASWVAAPGVDPASLVPYSKTGIDADAWSAMRSFRSGFIYVHFYGFFVLVALVLVHIVGVVVTEIFESGSIVSAMFSGRKILDRDPADDV